MRAPTSRWELERGALEATAGRIADRDLSREEWLRYFPGEDYRGTRAAPAGQ